jgi:hypothetical protein
MIKPKLFLISTIGFLCLSIMLSLLKPKTDPYYGSISPTTKIPFLRNIEEHKLIRPFFWNARMKDTALKITTKWGQRSHGNVFIKRKSNFSIKTDFMNSYGKNTFNATYQNLQVLRERLPNIPISIMLAPPAYNFIARHEFGYRLTHSIPEEIAAFENLGSQLEKIHVDFFEDYHYENAYYGQAYQHSDHHFVFDGALHLFNHYTTAKKEKKFEVHSFDKYKNNLANLISSQGGNIRSLSRLPFNQYSISSLSDYPWRGTILYSLYNPKARHNKRVLLLGNSFSHAYMPLFLTNLYSHVDHFYDGDGGPVFLFNLEEYVKKYHIEEIIIIALSGYADQVTQHIIESFNLPHDILLPQEWATTQL